ncbi:MAG: cbb3-type cytochrome c oxidase subunit I [Pseudohongiellaceae bacterium]
MSEAIDAGVEIDGQQPAQAQAAGDRTGLSSATNNRLIRAHGLAALVTLLLAVTFGIIASLQFIWPEFAGALPSWGRLRFAHTQGIMLGWLGNAFLAFLYLAVPVLSGRPVTSDRLGWLILGLWNLAVMLPGWLLVLSGVSQPLEWAEFPLMVDLVMGAGLALAAIQFLPGFFRDGFENLYVSSWYIIGALVFSLMSFPMGNIVPEFVPGAAGAAFSGLWIHDAVGLFVTPLALAILYYVIPASTGRPVFSHFLSMLGFWGLFFLYPLNGTHHYIFSVIPMATQTTAILASFMLGLVVIVVVSNLVLSQRGAGWLPRNPALRFASMSVVFYLIVSLQGSAQADMSFSQTIHFTDYVIGHSHLAMLGFATFASIAGLLHAWQKMNDAPYHAAAINWAYWLTTVGITIMVVDLTLAGLVQGNMWQEGAPWLDALRASEPYWLIRSISAIPITIGFGLLLYGLTKGPRGAGAQDFAAARTTIQAPEQDDSKHPFSNLAKALRMSYIVASVAGVTFFVFSVSLLGLLPQSTLDAQTEQLAPVASLSLTASEQRGRQIYAKEGCAYCHTQQIRFTEADIERFGAATLAWEDAMDTPHMLGTRRIGPDLSRAANTRSDQWHLAHLYAPRSVVPKSIMPSYPEYFNGSPLEPRQEAVDLVAYLNTLGRSRELAWPEGEAAMRTAAGDDEWTLMSLDASELNAHPGRTRPRGEAAPTLTRQTVKESGLRLWRQNCESCHGEEGAGDGSAAPWLQPPPINLTQHQYRSDLLADILWNGVYGSSMPGWRDRDERELAELVAVVQSFSAIGNPTITSASSAGAELFQTHCAECHGDEGDGDGFAVVNLPIPIPPTDFTRERLSMNESLRILRNGVPGTSMAPWGDRLSETEMQSVAGYLQTLYQAESGVGE